MPLSYQQKQTAIIFIVCILAVLAALWYIKSDSAGNKSSIANMTDNQNVQVVSPASIFASTTDWQNQFFGQSTSTILKGSPIVASSQDSATEPETVTGQFGKKFFEKFMILKQNNLTENDEAIQAVVDQNIDNIVSSAPKARVYDIRSVLIAAENDVIAERTYANMVGSIISLYGPKADAAILATEALENNDQTKIKEVNEISILYSTILKKLLETPAPKNISTIHLNLINAISSMAFVSQGMTKVFIDPMQSMVALAVYQNSLESLQNALLDLKYNFSTKKIIFSSDEPGAVFSLIN